MCRAAILSCRATTSGAKIEPAKKLDADLCWFDEEPLSPQRKYLLKQTTNTVFARIGAIKEVLDVHTLLHSVDRNDLTMNDIGRVALTLQKPLVCDDTTRIRARARSF